MLLLPGADRKQPVFPPRVRCTRASRSTDSCQARTLSALWGEVGSTVLGVVVDSANWESALLPTLSHARDKKSEMPSVLTTGQSMRHSRIPSQTHRRLIPQSAQEPRIGIPHRARLGGGLTQATVNDGRALFVGLSLSQNGRPHELMKDSESCTSSAGLRFCKTQDFCGFF